MTTGAPLYLVSACGSAEEFVAAFRRYADRTGLFVPMASPLPQGRRGRIALTLKDGGVMVEGEAEIVQSSAKSPLHGRAGMLVKFVEPDELSKVVLAELEKARLAMKPAPPTVPPRPAEVPSEPRPVPPAVGGRIDAANALAECVAIGDAGKLEEIAGAPPKAGQKFVVPAIPAMGGRPKTPTAPPEAKPTALGMPAMKAPEAKLDAVPQPPPGGDSKKLTKIGFPIVKPPAEPAKPEPKATTLGMAPLKDELAKPAPAKPEPKATTLGMSPIRETQPVGLVPQPPKVPETSDAAAERRPLPAPVPTRAKSGTTPPRHPTPAAPLPVTRMPAKPAPSLDLDEKTDLTEVPREPAAVALEAPAAESGKVATEPKPPTVAEPPAEPSKPQRSGGMRASEILAAVQVDDWTMTPDAPAPTVLPASPKLPADPKPAVAREPEIPEPTPAPGGPPTGDWTISLDPEAGWGKPEKLAAAATPPADKPTKIEKRIPTAAQTPSTGNPVHAVASEKPIEAVQWEDKPTSVGEKIEIDPTLMEPLQPMPADEELSATKEVTVTQTAATAVYPPGAMPRAPTGLPLAADPPAGPVPPPLSAGVFPPPAHGSMPPPPLSAGVFPPPSGSMPAVPNATGSQAAFGAPQDMAIGFAPTLLPGQLPAPPGPFGYPSPPPSYQPYQSESAPVVPMRSNKRLIVIVASAAAVVVIALVLALTMGHKKKHAAAEAHAKGSAGSAAQQAVVPPPLPIDAAVAAVVTPDVAEQGSGSAGSATQQVATPGSDSAPPAKDTCNVEVSSTPAGAEVSLEDKTVLGTTPGTFSLPCGAATKLYLKKPKYLAVIRSVTPAPEGTKVTATLGVAQFSVRLTSTPAGATITVGGRSKGVTPAAVQLPAFTTQTITLTKDGYQTDTQRVVIKSNGLSHHVVLKKGGRHR